ncbi:MAG: hypothetical protein KTR24_03690 [Saprospiraceae bacterium]|nr:hypothetical protein [Saprospiraceae bacterium]
MKIFLLPALILASISLAAQTTQSKVVDPTGMPISNVWINNTEENICTQSNQQGSFMVPGSLSADFQISALGYHTIQLSIADLEGENIILIPIAASATPPIESITGARMLEPLYVVDGVIKQQIKYLSSDQIESITVHKNNSMTRFYGEQGENGVLYVKTKD